MDWDIRLRYEQIPRAAAAFKRQIISLDNSYWGTPALTWDVIFVGHCGDTFEADKAAVDLLYTFRGCVD